MLSCFQERVSISCANWLVTKIDDTFVVALTCRSKLLSSYHALTGV